MTSSPGETPGLPPADAAMYQVATSLHAGLVADLDLLGPSPGYDERLSKAREIYPTLLFGALATSLASVEIAADATPAERSRGITEALRRIVTTPDLFEGITGAPFKLAQAEGLTADLIEQRQATEAQLATADGLRQQISEHGGLSREIVGRPVSLVYAYRPNLEKKRFLRKPVEEDSTSKIILKLAPTPDVDIKGVETYVDWNTYVGYRGRIGRVDKVLADIFLLTAADQRNQNANRTLAKLLNTQVRIGRVTTGTQLSLQHSFSQGTKQVGTSTRVQYSELSLPYTLEQAYLGSATNAPELALF